MANLMLVNVLGFSLMTLGYFWLWSFKELQVHMHIKFLTMQGYFFTWFFYLISILKKQSFLFWTRQAIFQFCLVLQIFITPAYWILIHSWMVNSGYFPIYQINWNIYIHLVPLVVLLVQLYCEPELQIKNRWKGALLYCLIFYFPICYLYTITQGPVYFFLTFQSLQSGWGFCGGCTLVILLMNFGLFYSVNFFRKNKLKTN